jgi:hypothetical protein
VPILVTVTTLVGPDVRSVAWKLWSDGWAVFEGPVQWRFSHPDVAGTSQAADRLRGAGLDPYLFIIEDHPDEEWSEGPQAVPDPPAPQARADAAVGEAPRTAGAPWTPEEDALLAGATAAEVARLTGRTLKAVERRRALLRRRRIGGAAAGEPGCPYAPPRANFWTAWEVALIGTMPDDEVAARCGKSLSAVKQKRVSLGISAEKVRRRGGMLLTQQL